MGLFKMGVLSKLGEWKDRILGRSREEDVYLEEDLDDVSWSEIQSRGRLLDVHDEGERRGFVQGRLEQMVEASEELERLRVEYATVTAYLKDMEEIEALPEEEMAVLMTGAQKILDLEQKRGNYLEKKHRMSDADFHRMDRMGTEAVEGCRKLEEAEEYQGRIRQDMSRLEGEKHAYFYRKNELKGVIADSRGIVIVGTVFLIACYVILFTLRMVLGMDVQLGFLCATALVGLVAAVRYFKYMSAVKELRQVEKGINRIIMLQNRVKIRFVNNTNLLDYLYMKYQVKSGREFKNLWKKYEEEKEERRIYREAELELEEYQQEFLSLLKCYQLKDPAIWLHQAAALLDSKEMVEIRHHLITRRQSLRRRMDYNREVVADGAEKEIRELAQEHPEYAGEILGMLDNLQ
ncbi:MAG: hypothetical protein IKM28_00080 [Lachnospiraceae bacterium]|nr:hypothetical protein [Lachnospiraceae bacterium]